MWHTYRYILVKVLKILNIRVSYGMTIAYGYCRIYLCYMGMNYCLLSLVNIDLSLVNVVHTCLKIFFCFLRTICMFEFGFSLHKYILSKIAMGLIHSLLESNVVIKRNIQYENDSHVTFEIYTTYRNYPNSLCPVTPYSDIDMSQHLLRH